MSDCTDILPILQAMATVICFGGASLLFLRRKSSRSRRMLAFIMFAWGVVYAVRVVGMILGNQTLNFDRIGVMETFVLVSGNLYLIFLLLYPLEIVRPGWLNMRRTGVLLLPYVSVTFLYYIVLFFLGESPEKLYDMTQFMRNIGDFNVWYRLFMLSSVLVYLVYLFRLTWYYKKFYRQWCRNNYSNDENMNISWLRPYGVGVVMIGIAYFGILFSGATYSLIIHNVTVQCFFSYTLYKGLFHENPYSESFFSDTLNESDACLKADLQENNILEESPPSSVSETAFLKKLPVYCDDVACWMAREKPYLNPDFKLKDVYDVLPLNRTYISRVFNEGFGSNFCDVVRGYRMREAEYLLANRKDIPVAQVAELSGFSSTSTFHRAFVQTHDGVTPNRYRKQCEK